MICNSNTSRTQDLVATIECCEKEKDFVSRDLAKDILEAEEEHVDWLEDPALINRARWGAELSSDGDENR